MEFDHWEDQNGNPVKPGDKLDDDAVLKPVFKEDGSQPEDNSHTVDFVPGEHGTIDDDSPIKTDKDGVVPELPTVTQDDGYEFDHWEDQNGNPVKPGDTLNDDATLKPVFRGDGSHTIDFVPGEHGTIDDDSPIKTDKNGVVPELPTVTPDDGYEFDHWEDQNGNPVKPGNKLDNDATLKPVFRGDGSHTIDFAPGEHGTIDDDSPIKTDPDGVVPELSTVTPDDGYEFDHWEDQNGNPVKPGDTLDDDATLKPVFRGDGSHTIDFAPGEYGTIDDDSPIKTDKNGVVPELPTVTSDDGYEFDHWEDQNGNPVKPGDKLDNDATLKPVFVAKAPVISFADGENGTVDDKTPIEATGNKVPALPNVTPNVGYEFDYWEDQNGNPVEPGDKIDADSTLKPVFRGDGSHAIDFAPGEHGTIDDDTPIRTDKNGIVPELPAVTPDDGYEFDHWEDQNSNPVKPGDKLDDDTTLKPIFVAKAPVISFADGENGTVDDKTPIKATGNRVPALPNVTPNNGYEFNHWEDQYGFLVDPGDYIDADSTLKPVFREDGSHAIDFAPGEHGTIDDNSPIRTDKDGVVPGLPTVTPDDGYEFDYWEDQHGNPVKPGDKLDNDATLKPVFRDDGSHTIDFVPGEHGTIDDDSPIKTDKDGVILELPSVTPDNGYMFDHWEDQNGNPVKPGDKLDNDTILKPVFRIDNYVSIVPIPGETLTPQEAQAAGWKYGPYGEELQITGFSNTAYKRDIEVPSHIGDFSIVRIGDDVFSGQSGLRKIIIPDSITSIGTSAFENCAGLTELTMNNVVEMGDSACKGCTKLVEVEGSFRTVGSSAFEECTSLKSIDLSSVSSLGKNAFKNCIELTNANISDSVTEIPEGAFQGCSKVCSINLPESVTSIGDRAFDGCESLTDDLVTLPKSVTSLGALAFANTNLSTQIYFGKKGPGKDYATLAAVSSRIPLNTPYRIFVGPGLVVNDNAYGLKEWQHETGKNLSICTSNFKDGDTIYAYIDEKTPEPPSLEASPQSWFVSDGKGTLLGTSDEYNNLVNAPTDLVVPKSLGGAVITTIGEAAFADKSLLTSIVLPDTVRSFGPRAFAGCTSATVFVSKISEPNWDKWAAHNCWNAFSRVKNIVVDKLSDIPANYYLGALDTGTQVYTSKGKAPYNVSYTKVSLPSTGTVPPLFIKNPPAREGIGRVVAYTDYSFIDLGGVTPTGNSSYEKHYITVNKGSDKPTGAYAYSKYQGGGYKQTTSIEILWNWFNITVNGKSFRWGPLKRFEEHVEFT